MLLLLNYIVNSVSVDVPVGASPVTPSPVVHCSVAAARRGKPPPIDSYSENSAEIHFDDWLPTLDRPATWNGWSVEKLLQLAGHLHGRALQEWNLITAD